VITECEQVIQRETGNAYHFDAGVSIITVCTQTARHLVKWGERDMHPGEMRMCDDHMKDFLADAEYCEDIEWTFHADLGECTDTLPLAHAV
jgi:hypothetical protein